MEKKKPFVAPSGPLVAYDCDDTLVMWDLPDGMMLNDDALVTIPCRGQEERCLPNEHNITLLKKFAMRGHTVIVWSGGGVDWAEAVIKGLGLEEYVDVIMSKPAYYIDDIKDPTKWIGKHGYIDMNGKRSGHHMIQEGTQKEQK
tara:strand:- start:9962 stop:10393 length:432 start_codon:yes stop_codon:yes gene_type:complete